MRYAGFWRRLAAWLVDTLILAVLGGPAVFMIVHWLVKGDTLPHTAEEIHDMRVALGILLTAFYFVAMESSPQQATLGKQLVGIRIVDSAGRRVSASRALGRHFGKFLSILLFFTGFIMISFTSRKQGLHDILSGCLVVRRD